MFFDKGVDDGRFCGLKMLADRGLLDVKRLSNGALRATPWAVVVPHLDGLVENEALFFREQFKEIGAVQRLSARVSTCNSRREVAKDRFETQEGLPWYLESSR